MDENPPANAGGTGSVPGPGRSHVREPRLLEAPTPEAHPSQEKPPQGVQAKQLESSAPGGN